ncbi:oxidoreductase [Halolactibacillus miurensis]|uniref:Oxidoreductase n=1 Tax=Halolactibacillus miurensis TaxID=306541 RepID=A0A1I6SAW2_9BACI|nr:MULTISPECIES: Gfo/Idh/MocA family oxidoreductase [Halolactibacillus]GEM03977.1 oxidoreductase [Halolactibacillus miurensis]SFS74101.1 Predicted dehydrogenase [Halolactibacillus miurensis]
MTQKVRWGVLSTASIAQNHVIPAFMRAENAEVVAISSLSGRAEEVAEALGIEKAYDSYHEVLDDETIDAVYIPLPNSLHKEWAIRAAYKKKHILVEKPMALSSTDVLEIKQACLDNDVMIMEAFMYMLHPQHQRVKALIEEGAIGEVKHFESTFTFYLADRDSNIRMEKELGGGSLYDVGSYNVHAMRYILNEEPISVRSDAVIDEASGVDLTSVSYYTFKSGVTASLTSSFDHFHQNAYKVIGTEGMITVPYAYRPDNHGGLGEVILQTNTYTKTETFMNDLYRDEAEHISYAILNNQEPINTLTNSYQNMRVLESTTASFTHNETVTIDNDE